MFVIAKRTILFRHEDDQKNGNKKPRECLIQGSKDVQEVPDWLEDQSAFIAAQHDDKERGITADIMVVVPQKRVAPPPMQVEKKPAIVPPAKPAEPAKTAEQKPAQPDVVDLTKMTKDALQLHALEVHGVELDDNLKKDEMIAAIEEAKKKAAKP